MQIAPHQMAIRPLAWPEKRITSLYVDFFFSVPSLIRTHDFFFGLFVLKLVDVHYITMQSMYEPRSSRVNSVFIQRGNGGYNMNCISVVISSYTCYVFGLIGFLRRGHHLGRSMRHF